MPQNYFMSVIYQSSPSSSYTTKWNREKLWCILQLLLILVIIPLPAFPQRPFRKKNPNNKEVKLRSSKATHLQLLCNHSHPKESTSLPWLESKTRETSLCEYYPHLLFPAVLMIFLCMCLCTQQLPIILIVTDVTWLEKQLVSMVRRLLRVT